jgi:hypothetical protein
MPKTSEKVAEKSQEEVAAVNSGPTREEIEIRAYQIYQERGGAEGSDVEDWLQAESELLNEASRHKSSAKAVAA